MLSRFFKVVWDSVLRRPSGSAATDILLERARQLRAEGNLGAARRTLEEGIRHFPDEAQLLNNLGMLQLADGDFPAAERNFRRALEVYPSLAQAHSNLGIALCEQHRAAEGLQAFRRAIAVDSQLLAARENVAALLTRENDYPGALDAWDSVLRLEPRHADAHAAKGLLLVGAGLFAEAREQLAHARRLKLDTQPLTLLEVSIEAAIGDVAAARFVLERLRGREPDAEIEWQLALLHLSQGNFAEGWPLYEARLRRELESPRRAYAFPDWDGSPLDGHALLIMAEQGLGDEIMFASCLADAAARVSRCVIECDPRLAPLFARSFTQAEVVGHVRGTGHDWLKRHPDIAYQIHAGSLPRLFRASRDDFPRHDGYLRADGARVSAWRARLAALGRGLKIGIAWSGGLRHTRRALRSIPLSDFSQLLGRRDVQFVSLQHDDDGRQAQQLAELAGTPVHLFAGSLADMDESAALITALDLVITACSAVVHLTGALGARAWVLTPRVAEWRYLNRGEAMPWYPSVRLFRQARLGDWRPVIREVNEKLEALAACRT